jgi:hypothetical protein
MIAALTIYLAFSLAIGIVAILGIANDKWSFCVEEWFGFIMGLFFPSYFVVILFFIVWALYRRKTGGAA